MFTISRAAALWAGLVTGSVQLVAAQEQVWLQIEAQPNQPKAEERMGAYAASLAQVQGFRLDSGWYGIALGPYAPDQAVELLQSLTASGAIPADSYITDGSSFSAPFGPGAGQDPSATTNAQSAGQEVQIEMPAVQSAEPPAASSLPDETVAEAKDSEAALSGPERETLQMALKWFGFYDGRVDGRIGSGSRQAMAAWQEAQGFETTGVLTTAQRDRLVQAYRNEEGLFGFELVTEVEAGIEVTLPMAMLEMETYAPPFVQYKGRDGAGLSAMLISEPGTRATLAGLYDVLQTLDTIPADGERALGEDSFTIRGADATQASFAFAQVYGGNVKGFVLTWDAALTPQMDRVLPMVQSSFRSTGETALDPGLVPLDEAVKRGLIAGIAAKKPKSSATGFFVDPKGAVVTLSSAVAGCGRVTLDHRTEVTVSAVKGDLALLTPQSDLAPRSFAAFAGAMPQPGAPVTLSGYSWGDRLSAPVLTRGAFEEARGLQGEAGLARLGLQAQAGDAGGPVLDETGAVLGLLLPRPEGLPEGVALLATAEALSAFLADPAGPGLTLSAATSTGRATPDALTQTARDMTVLVSCWN